jgi:hypothetical protein
MFFDLARTRTYRRAGNDIKTRVRAKATRMAMRPPRLSAEMTSNGFETPDGTAGDTAEAMVKWSFSRPRKALSRSHPSSLRSSFLIEAVGKM